MFGHTHQARIDKHTTGGKAALYANSGTWVDASTTGTKDYLLITPLRNETDDKTIGFEVGQYRYHSKNDVSLMNEVQVAL